MSRSQLLGAASAAALTAFSFASHAATPRIQGGGSTLAEFEWIDEMGSIWNPAATGTQALFGTYSTNSASAIYSPSGSGGGQNGFLNDDFTCMDDVVTGNNGGVCANSPPGTQNYVYYGASDATLSSTQISGWLTSAYGQAVSGNLIQLPVLGVGIAFPISDTGYTKNGQASLSSHDLCEIFSGGYTDFSQITDAVTTTGVATKFAPGAFHVVYRGDGSGTTFITTEHLAAVCTPGTDTPAGFTFTAVQKFATLFNAGNGGGANTVINGLTVVTKGLNDDVGDLPADGPQGSSGVAGQLETYQTAGTPALGYISPDFTTIDPKSDAMVHGAKPTLHVAGALQNGLVTLPTVHEIELGLTHAKAGYGSNLNPPSTAAQGANPGLWVPGVALTTTGYPAVGYTTIEVAQCYANKSVTTSMIAFLNNHFGTKAATDKTPYLASQARNGFAPIANSGASRFLKAIAAHILANAGGWNTNIGNPTACKGKAGR
jgi:ABC-type phosphate transport system substrate-binding protein